MALDFEVVTGMNIPPPLSQRQGQITLLTRGVIFLKMLKTLGRQHPSEVLVGGEQTHVHTLNLMGAHNTQGLTRRPVLAGGAETERLVRGLAHAAPLPTAGKRPTGLKGAAARYVPQHLDGRDALAQKWHQQAEARGPQPWNKGLARRLYDPGGTQKRAKSNMERSWRTAAAQRSMPQGNQTQPPPPEETDSEEGTAQPAPKRTRHGRASPNPGKGHPEA